MEIKAPLRKGKGEMNSGEAVNKYLLAYSEGKLE